MKYMAKPKTPPAPREVVELTTGKVVWMRLKIEQLHQQTNEILNQIVAGVPFEADELKPLWEASADLLAEINTRWETTAP
jgi:hypothetical protein